jgi:hypothetical protein
MSAYPLSADIFVDGWYVSLVLPLADISPQMKCHTDDFGVLS